MESNLRHLKNVFILLANGFEEGPLIYCVDKLRSAGFHVKLVSLSKRLVNSKHGVYIKGDITLSELKSSNTDNDLVIIPGGTESTASLLTDPRTHLLFSMINQNKGYMAAMDTAVPILNEFDIPETFSCRFISKYPTQDILQFSSELIQKFSDSVTLAPQQTV